MEKFYFGIDIGGTAMKHGVFTADGTLLEKWEIPTPLGEQGSYILPAVAKEVRHWMAEKGYNMAQLAGVGVGIPGPVRSDGLVERCVNLDWGNVNPAKELSALLDGIPVAAGNDANVAAMGEYWQGGGKGYDSVVFITLGTGVGSGIILDGRMIHGSKGLGGEIGHIIVDPSEKEPCSCGHYGCLNQIASATGIVYRAKRMLQAENTASCMRGLEKLTCKDVFDAAKAGDAVAVKSVRNCLGFLGKSISDVSYTVDPDVFIIGGGVAKAGQYLIDETYEAYSAMAKLADGRAKIVLAQLGNDAGIYGAAKLALDLVLAK